MDSGHTPNKKIEAYWTDCSIPWISLNDTAYLKDHDYIENTAIRKFTSGDWQIDHVGDKLCDWVAALADRDTIWQET